MAEVRLLLADDHPVTRLGLRTLFSSAPGIRFVGEAADGEQALELIASTAPDVAVLDLKLPKRTALEVLESLKPLKLATRVLVLTAQTGTEPMHHAKALGARGYLTKDTPADSLVRAVHDIAQGRECWDPAMRRDTLKETLSPRELQVLKVLVTGGSNKEIAQQLGLADGTVRIHLSNIFAKLGVGDRTSAVTLALRQGLVELS